MKLIKVIVTAAVFFSSVNTQESLEEELQPPKDYTEQLKISELPIPVEKEKVLLVQDLENEFDILFNKTLFGEQIKMLILNNSGGNITGFNRTTLEIPVLKRTVDKVNWILDHNDTIEEILNLSFREKWQKTNVSKEDVIEKLQKQTLEKINNILDGIEEKSVTPADVKQHHHADIKKENSSLFKEELRGSILNQSQINLIGGLQNVYNKTNQSIDLLAEKNLNKIAKSNVSAICTILEQEYLSLYNNTFFKQQLKEIIQNTTDVDARKTYIGNLVRNRTAQQVDLLMKCRKDFGLILNNTISKANLSQLELINKVSNSTLQKIIKIIEEKETTNQNTSLNIENSTTENQITLHEDYVPDKKYKFSLSKSQFIKKLKELLTNNQVARTDILNFVRNYTTQKINWLIQHNNNLDWQNHTNLTKIQLIDNITNHILAKIDKVIGSKRQETTTIFNENTTEETTTNFSDSEDTTKTTQTNNVLTEKPTQPQSVDKEALVKSILHKADINLKALIKRIQTKWNQPTIPTQELIESIRQKSKDHVNSILQEINNWNDYTPGHSKPKPNWKKDYKELKNKWNRNEKLWKHIYENNSGEDSNNSEEISNINYVGDLQDSNTESKLKDYPKRISFKSSYRRHSQEISNENDSKDSQDSSNYGKSKSNSQEMSFDSDSENDSQEISIDSDSENDSQEISNESETDDSSRNNFKDKRARKNRKAYNNWNLEEHKKYLLSKKERNNYKHDRRNYKTSD